MSLLSNSILSYVRRGVQIGEWCQIHPYVWDEQLKGPKLVESPWRFRVWYLNVLVTFVYYIFVVTRAVQVNLSPDFSKAKKIYMQFACVYFISPSIMQITFMLNLHSLPVVIQQYLILGRRLKNEYGLEGSKKLNKICHLLMGLVFYGFNTISVLVCIGSYLRPESPEFLSSLLPNPRGLGPISRIPFALFMLYMELIFHGIAFLLTFNLIGSATLQITALKNMASWSGETLRGRHGDLVVIYRALEMNVKATSKLFCDFFIPAVKTVLILFAIFCTYGAIRLHGLFSLTFTVMGLNTTSVLIGVFLFLAEVHSASIKFFEEVAKNSVPDGGNGNGMMHRQKAAGPKEIVGRNGASVEKITISSPGVTNASRLVHRNGSANEIKDGDLIKIVHGNGAAVENRAVPTGGARGSLLLRKSIKSMPILKIRMRTWYMVDRQLVLTMLQIIFDNSVNFLIANSH